MLRKLGVALAAALLLWMAVALVDEYIGVAEMPFEREVPILGGSDFPAFYGGSRLFVSDPARAYDGDAQLRAILDAKGYGPEHVEPGSPWYRYYNPPAFSLLLAPLTLVDIRTAFAVTLFINLACLMLLLGVLSRILAARRTLFLFLAAGVLTSVPLNYAFWHGQPTLFLAALFGLSLLAIESNSPRLAGGFWALAMLKPHWLGILAVILPFRDRRTVLPFILVLVALLLPFLAIGPAGIEDYVRLLLSRGQGDIADESFAEAVLSWPGFFRGLTGEPQPREAVLLSGLTIAALILVLRRGVSSDRAPIAVALTALLAVPHSHPQDWIILAPAAAFLMRRQDGLALAGSAALLLSVSLGLHNWAGLRDRARDIYWPTLAAFSLLVWTLVLSELEHRRLAEPHLPFSLIRAKLQTSRIEGDPSPVRIPSDSV